jgi:nucleotide-binding universal stress UspA family protein
MKTTASEKTAAVMGRIKASYPRIQHILVPLDFSGKSRQALRYAVPLAQKFTAKIHLVHVLPAADQVRAGRPSRPQAHACNQAAR